MQSKDGGYNSCHRCYASQELDDQNKVVYEEDFDPDLRAALRKSIHN